MIYTQGSNDAIGLLYQLFVCTRTLLSLQKDKSIIVCLKYA